MASSIPITFDHRRVERPRPRCLAALADPADRAWFAGSLAALGVDVRLFDDAADLLQQYTPGQAELVLLEAASGRIALRAALAFLRLQDPRLTIVLLRPAEAPAEPWPDGVTACLSRPLDAPTLARVLRQCLPALRDAGGPRAGDAREPTADLGALRADFLARLDGQYLQPMQAAARAEDWPTLRRTAQRLAGSAAGLGLPELAAAALRLETVLRSPLGVTSEALRQLLDGPLGVGRAAGASP